MAFAQASGYPSASLSQRASSRLSNPNRRAIDHFASNRETERNHQVN
jgi:hypothetical protein